MTKAFLDYLTYEKRYSPHTILGYRTDLDQFLDFLSDQETDGQYEVESAGATQVRNWVVHLLDADISARSIGRKLSTLKSYYKYLIREGRRADDPMQVVIAPRTGKRLPVFVEQGSMESLFSAEGLFDDSFVGRRDRLMVHLLYMTGLRVSELISLETRGYDSVNSSISVIGKRNKERQVPLGSVSVQLIEEYLRSREQEGLQQCAHLLIRDDGQQMYHRFVYRKVNEYLGKVTSLKKKSPHVLRHTFATHMLNNGADIHAIKEILGHSSLAATQVYTHNSIDKLKDIHRRTHPRG